MDSVFTAGMPGIWQIVLIAVVVLLLFGGKKIPELMKGIGRGIREFKDGMNQDEQNDQDNRKISKE